MSDSLINKLEKSAFTMGLIDDAGDKVKVVNLKDVQNILEEHEQKSASKIIADFNELCATELNDSDLQFFKSAASNQDVDADVEIYKRSK